MMPSDLPLKGLRVVELGQLLAGPFCGYMLAGFGAEVIKVEPPHTGDPLRTWRKVVDGTSLWWRSLSRNKLSITCDLRKPEGRTLLRRLAEDVDILVENFRPGRMESWQLDYDTLAARNSKLIMVRISGFGQTGPKAHAPGFANVAEAFAGLRHLTGEPGRPPVRAGISLGDSLAGLHGAYGALCAVYERDVRGSGRGQVVDVALTESVFNMLESLLPEYDLLQHVRGPAGGGLPGIVPSNTYVCADGKSIVVGANSDRLFRQLMRAIERPELAADPRLSTNDGRSDHATEIDTAIAEWTLRHPARDALAVLEKADVPCGPINTIADIVRDPQFIARNAFDAVELPDGRNVRIPAVTPLLSRTPGETRWPGPELGAHNETVYRDRLGLTDEQVESLRKAGVI